MGEDVERGDSFNNESIAPIVIVYPRNSNATNFNNPGISESTKLVYGTHEVERKAVKELAVTAKKEGDASVVANHVTYRFHCHGSEVTMKPGEKKFYPGISAESCTNSNDKAVKVEDFTQKTPSLFDCEKEAKDSLSGYSQIANTDVNMSGAEFVFTSVGNAGEDLYTIQSALNNKYLINSDGAEFFGTQPIQHEIRRPDGSQGFEIKRIDKNNEKLNNRFIFFYYTKMRYDATSDKNFIATGNGDTKPLIERGNFAFELLEKQEYPSDADQIRGYKRVTSVTSGKHYLITQVYNDQVLGEGRIVLYPGDNIKTWSKLYRDVETPGVLLTAIGNNGDSSDVNIGDRNYKIVINGTCSHTDYKFYLKGAVDATCTVEGYTGDVYCENCDAKIEDGKAIPAGHDVPVWNVSKEPSFTEDGEKSGTCSICKDTITATYLKDDYVKEELDKKVLEAQGKREQEYTAKSYAILSAALRELDGADTTDKKIALYNKLNDAIAGLEKKTDFDKAKNKLKAKLVKMQEAINKGEAAFESGIWTALNNAVIELKEEAIGIDLTTLNGEAEIDAKLETLKLSVLNLAWEKVENINTNTIEEEQEAQEREKLARKIKEAVSGAKDTYDAGQGDYTDDSWDAFEKAYREANVSDEDLEEMTKEELQGLLDALTTAIANLKTNTNGGNSELEAAKAEIGKAVQAADAIVAGGQKNYTKASWDAFMAAYNAAKNAPANADAATLKKLAEALANAQKALQTEPAATLQKGYTEDVKGIRYEVLDPAKMTVKAKTGLNKKAKSITIPATVTLKGSFSCKVVEVGNKAFSGYKKATKITIGKNVTIIGKQAFMNTKNLKQIILKGKGLKKESSIKAKAFKGSTKKKVKIKWAKGTKNAQKKKVKKGLKRAGLKV